MMSSTNDQDASGRKRRRIDGDNDANRGVAPAAQGGSAASPANNTTSTVQSITSRLGPRLEKAAPLLETQPTELQDLLIPKLQGMLSLVTTIGQRHETLEKHKLPMVDPKTKKTMKMLKFPDQDLPFIPSSLRKACPIKSSDALKDDPGMKALLDAAASDWEHFAKVKMAMHDRAVKEYEITKRHEMLQEQFFDFATIWAKGIIIAKRETGDLPLNSELTWTQYALLIAHNTMASYDATVYATLGFATNSAMIDSFGKYSSSFNYRDVSAKATIADKEFIKNLYEAIAPVLKGITVGIWFDEQKKDTKRKINAAIRAELGTEQTAQATADTRSALDSAGAQSQEQRLLDAARKAARAESSKQVQRILTNQRKKSLGDTETQASTPTNNGRSSKQKSKKSTKQQKQKQQQKQQPKSALKKGAQVRFSSSSNNDSSNTPVKAKKKGKGKAGGARGGKQKRSA